MFSTTGTVISLLDNGFVIRCEAGSEQLIKTMLPGWRLDLAAGDEVHVFGGPDPRDGHFASSSIRRRRPTAGDGGSDWIEVKDF